MLRTVEPHDLLGACKECGITLSVLCERTGIPGRVARVRCRTVCAPHATVSQSSWLTDDLPPGQIWLPPIEVGVGGGDAAREVEDEHRQEDEEDAK